MGTYLKKDHMFGPLWSIWNHTLSKICHFISVHQKAYLFTSFLTYQCIWVKNKALQCIFYLQKKHILRNRTSGLHFHMSASPTAPPSPLPPSSRLKHENLGNHKSGSFIRKKLFSVFSNSIICCTCIVHALLMWVII